MLEQINQIAQSNPEYAIAIAFIFAFIESLPFIGSFFPGMLTMPPIGWLMASGVIPGWQTFSLIIVGAMLGDYVGFFIGYAFRDVAHKKASIYNKLHWLSAGESFIQHHGPLSIIIGRFIGPFRSSVPLFAGIFKMNSTHFSLAALPSVFLWAVVHLSPGAFIAWFNFDIFAQTSLIINVLMLTCLGACCCALFFSNQLASSSKIESLLTVVCHRIRQPLAMRPVILRVILLIIGLALASLTIINGGTDTINQAVFALISSQHAPIVQLSLIHTAICYIPFVLLLTALLSIVLAYQDKYDIALQLFLSVSIAFIVCFALKYLIHYPRPSHVSALLGNQSLPSGHSCITTAFILSYMMPDHQSNSYRSILSLAFIVLTMASRVLIGAHWISDVVVGWMIGYLAYQISLLITPLMPVNLLRSLTNYYHFQRSSTIVAGLSHIGIIATYACISLLYAMLTNKLSVGPYLI